MFQQLFHYTHNRYRAVYDRERYENILHDPDSVFGKKLNNCIQFFIILGVFIIILESIPSLSQSYSGSFFTIDIIISSVFAVEYIYRFLRAKSKKYFFFRPLNIIDILSFLPFFIGLLFQSFVGMDIFKALRLLRLFRLFEISVDSPIVLGFLQTLKQYKQEYKAVAMMFITILTIVSSLVYYLESPLNSQFQTIPHSMWWGIVTMATVGYGDMVPATVLGKILGAVLIVIGPILLAVISSITILVFMDVAESQKQIFEKICSNCHEKNKDDAHYCSYCAGQEFSNIVRNQQEKRLNFVRKIFSK